MKATQIFKIWKRRTKRVIRTDTNETVRKLADLTERARLYGRAEGSLVPVGALVTIETEHWV